MYNVTQPSGVLFIPLCEIYICDIFSTVFIHTETFPLTQTSELSVYWRHDTAAIHKSSTHVWSYRGQRVPLAAWTGINFVVSWDRAVNAWNQCESLHRTAHVLILQLKGWIPYILGLMYVDLNLKTNSNHYGDIVCIQSWFWFEINLSSFSSK